ncbi:MAG: response regulator transcription factor [Defluviitaleaceae bacterium]|nr:response regulator transcription factor [Defluviitaleaceae bacterium]MCL2262282.1 response regulator transcription factor [Defluviitaleaceae bacterium]
MAKILVCDDEQGLRALIKKYAEFEGHTTTEVCDGLQAVEVCKEENFDVIIMDIMMPEMDGLAAIKVIRGFSDAPVIMLSARGDEHDRVLAFELGADDYVVKPFSTKELMLRIAVVLRRKETPVSSIFQKDGFVADIAAYKVTIDGEQVELASKLYDLLFFLMRNKGTIQPRKKILSEVWGYDYFGDERTLDTHMKLLRKSLGKYGSLLKTLRGVGYKFDENGTL